MNFYDCKKENIGIDIICPYCKNIQDNDTKYQYVTYWGDDGNHKECSCEECGKTFMVIEKVEREFATYKKEIGGMK